MDAEEPSVRKRGGRDGDSSTPADNVARRASRNSRVHFTEDGYIPVLQEANPILVQVVGEEQSKTIGVYLGFLQEDHKYSVLFTLSGKMLEGYLAAPSTEQEGEGSHSSHSNGALPEQNPSSSHGTKKPFSGVEVFLEGGAGEGLCHVTDCEWVTMSQSKNKKGKGLQIKMEVTVPSTKDFHVLEDRFCLRRAGGRAASSDRIVRVNVGAKIMGKTMGTPTLKDGIKCIGVCRTSDSSNSEASDEEENEVEMKDGDGKCTSSQ